MLLSLMQTFSVAFFFCCWKYPTGCTSWGRGGVLFSYDVDARMKDTGMKLVGQIKDYIH